MASSKDPPHPREFNLFDDVFHPRGDDDDEKYDGNIDFDNLVKIMETQNELQVDPIDDDDGNADTAVEEERLSQKLGQLSASQERTTTTTAWEDVMPDFLSSSNKLFDQMMDPILGKTASSITIEDLRQVAYLVYVVALDDIQKPLWTTYLHSGTGKLQIQNQQQNPIDGPSVWPLDVKTTIIKKGLTAARHENEIDHDTCLNYTYKYLRELNVSREQEQTRLIDRKRRLKGFTTEMEKAIEQFVHEQRIAELKLTVEYMIKITEYEYTDQLIELECLRLKPNVHQLPVFKNLCQIRRKQEEAKADLEILKQRVFYHQLPSLFYSLQVSPPSSLNAITDSNIRQRLYNRYQKLVQRTRSDMMAVYVAAAEANLREYQQKFGIEVDRWKKNQRDAPLDERLTEKMIDILHRRFKHITEHFKYVSDMKVLFFRQSSGVHEQENRSHRFDDDKKKIGCSPSIIVDAIHHLSSEQVTFLNRGPTYVPPCQMHISSSLPLEQMLLKQSEPFRRQLGSFFSKYNINPNRRMTFAREIKKLFKQSFSTHLPEWIQQRALCEKQLVQSIRRQLKNENLILRRTADQNNVFYLGRKNDFEQKANDYMTNATSYEMIGSTNQNNPQQPQLAEMIQSITSILEDLRQRKRINEDQLAKMRVKTANVELPYLYFVPEPLQDGDMSVQPMISSANRCPIQPLAHFLDELLRPLYDTYTPSTRLSNGADLIERLVDFEEELHPMTHFATFKIDNFYNMVSHERIIAALGQFLYDVLSIGQHQHLSIETIQELTGLVLRNNLFTYNGNIYRYVKGSPLSLPLTRTLGNIYLRYWQMSFVRKLGSTEEFYGRYHDMAILTWNAPVTKLRSLLDELDQKHPDIRITTTIGFSVHFLGAYIENRRRHLVTHVHHEPTVQPYVLPYVIGHPRLIYRQWFQWALTRAVLYCTSAEDFDAERIYIELTLLANGHSLDFVKSGIQTFFSKFFAVTLESGPDHHVYRSLRLRMIRSIEDEKKEHKQQQLLESNNRLIHLHYLYDWGPRCLFNEQFKKLWYASLKDDPEFKKHKLEMDISTIHCYSSNALLAQQAPPRRT